MQLKLNKLSWLYSDTEVAKQIGYLKSITYDTNNHHLLIEGSTGALAVFCEGFTYGGGVTHYEFGCLINDEACNLVVFEHQGKVRVNHDSIRSEEWLRTWESNHSKIDIEELRMDSFGTVGFAWDIREFLGVSRSVGTSDFNTCLERYTYFRKYLAESRPSSAWYFYRMTDEEFKDFIQYSWDKCE